VGDESFGRDGDCKEGSQIMPLRPEGDALF
jgi:hypothetical protein